MSPAIATQLALRVWPLRLKALLVSVAVIVLVGATFTLGHTWPSRLAFALAGPVLGLSWAVLCVASWFHPENGTLSASARFFGRLPVWLQSAVRWQASMFLLFFVIFGLIVWPAFAASNLWLLVR